MADVCANCETQADYAYEPSLGNVTKYCKKHLPGFLARLGSNAILKDLAQERFLAPAAPAAKTTKKKASETASEEKEAAE